MRLIYKGDGDYDVVFGSGPVMELSYDGSDHAVGDWTFWALRIGKSRIGSSAIIGDGEFAEWLEREARDDGGRLSDEPVQLRGGAPENQSQRVIADAAASRAVQGGGSTGSPPGSSDIPAPFDDETASSAAPSAPDGRDS